MNYQHSAIKGRGLTLPSVEGGFGSLNILRDPPASIQTRYKPKVGDTSRITEWIGNSGDRICEGINKFARGVNPMVSVSYSNYGTNGGQMRDGSGRIGTDQGPISIVGNQSYLPYRVNREGAFRPPIIPPQELLPLSRLPRLPFSYSTNPGSNNTKVDIDSLRCGANLKEIRNDLIRVCGTTRAIFNIESPSTCPNEVKNCIVERCKGDVVTNKSDTKNYVLGINQVPDRGIKTQHHTLYGSIPVNVSNTIQGTPIQNFTGNQPMPIQNTPCGSYATNISGTDSSNYIHQQRSLDRNIPLTSITTNCGQQGVDINFNAREYKNLPIRRSRGGFENTGFQQIGLRDQPTVLLK